MCISSLLCRRVFRCLRLLPITAVLGLRVFAQGSQEQSALRHWQIRDGLPENNVQALAETADGYLWIGTSGGLVRFDGEEFQTYDHSNTDAFAESNVTALLAVEDDLWIGTEGGGLILKHGQEMKSYPIAGLANTSIRALSRGKDSRLFASTNAGNFSWVDAKGSPARLQRDQALGLQIVARTENTSRPMVLRERSSAGEASGRNPTQVFVEAADGTQWEGTEWGLFRKRPGAQAFQRYGRLRFAIRTLLLGSDGRLWVGTTHDGLFWIQNDRCVAVEQFERHRALTIQTLLEDENHSIWVGTQAGVFQLIRSETQLVRLPHAFPSDFETLALDLDGSILVAARRLYRIVDNALVPVPLPQLGKVEVRNAVRDTRGNLWIGTVRDGVFKLGSHSLLHVTSREGLANDSVRVMSPAPDGSLWVGTDNGVSQIRNGRVTTYRTANGLADDFVQAVVAGRDGDVWVGTAHGLSHLQGGVFQDEEIVEQLRSEKVWTIFATPQRNVWIGTRSDGLYCLHEGHVVHFTTAQGLGSNSIYKIVGSERDSMWLSGPGGVSVVSQRDLLLQPNTGKEISPVFFYISDGQETPNFYGGVQASGVMSANGDVWFPTDHGPVRIPVQADVSRHLRLQIRNLEVNGKNVPANADLLLHSDDSNLQVHYGAVLLLPQSGVRYRYRLDNLDKQWTYAKDRTTAYFTNLPSGNLRFRVQAYDTRSPENLVEAVLLIHKEPRLFRRLWFLTLCAALLFLALWSVHRFRVRSAHARVEAVYAERMRLSREVHDTVLQGCAGISTLLEACSSTPARHEQREMLLNTARLQIVSTMEDARSAIQNFRESGAPDLDVSAALGEMISRVEREFQRTIGYVYEGVKVVLPTAMTHEVQMVAREALYNALVHSGGTRVDVRACGSRHELLIEVLDNGKGVLPEGISKAGHYGIKGMRERIHTMRGHFELGPAKPQGTVVNFRVPLSRGRD